MAAACIIAAVVVVPANDAVFLVVVDAETFEAGAIVRAAVVGVAAGQNVVDTTLNLTANAGATDRALRALPIGATFTAVGAGVSFAADQTFTTIKPRAFGIYHRSIDNQPAKVPRLPANVAAIGRALTVVAAAGAGAARVVVANSAAHTVEAPGNQASLITDDSGGTVIVSAACAVNPDVVAVVLAGTDGTACVVDTVLRRTERDDSALVAGSAGNHCAGNRFTVSVDTACAFDACIVTTDFLARRAVGAA